MKVSHIGLLFIAGVLVISSCKEDKEQEESGDILPRSLTIDVPTAISSKSGVQKSTGSEAVMEGDEIYENQRLFIAVAEESALIADAIIDAIRTNNISQPMTLTYDGDDQRPKTLIVSENATYDNKTYRYKLSISDAEGTAMQVFWNSSPASGVAILSPYYIDRVDNEENPDFMVRIEYDEDDASYDATMIISISGWMSDNDDELFAVDKMKMFVGKKGSRVDLHGASNHPRAKLIDNDTISPGLCWAFTARADDDLDIAVAKVALPPSSLNSTNNLFTSYSIANVMTSYVTAEYQFAVDQGYITQEQLSDSVAAYLVHAQAPAYFKEENGYISCGDSIPGIRGFDTEFIDLSGMDTYAPKTVADLEITFQDGENK